MLDVFTEEIEVILKTGIANLYWYRDDLKKCWFRAGVPTDLASRIYRMTRADGSKISKRQMMDRLYEELRDGDYNRRLEISRNLVRVLVEQQDFVPQSENHRVEEAERSALKLKELVHRQQEDKRYRDSIRRRAKEAKRQDYFGELQKLRDRFAASIDLEAQKRGYKLQGLFHDLMKLSGIPVERPFRVEGEEIDGAFKYDGRHYLVELRWRKEPAAPSDIGQFHYKIQGKFEERGIFVSMNGFSSTVEKTVPKGRAVRVLLFDGSHLTNVLSGLYTFQELMEHAISRASSRGEIYCAHNLAASDRRDAR